MSCSHKEFRDYPRSQELGEKERSRVTTEVAQTFVDYSIKWHRNETQDNTTALCLRFNNWLEPKRS